MRQLYLLFTVIPGLFILLAFHKPLPMTHTHRTGEVLVAAAADLQYAMDSLVKLFSGRNSGITIKSVYGSSGTFFQQISNNAPFDIFFSADLEYPRKLEQLHKTLSPVRSYGTGQLVLWSNKLDPAAAGMNTLLSVDIKKIAMANPAHAPYGRRAEESLKYFQLYDKVHNKLVIGENISQTAQFVSTGAADIGLIALSLALSPRLQKEGKYWLVPESSHQPLKQGFVVLQHAEGNDGAQKFAAFVESPEARSILQYFGFGK